MSDGKSSGGSVYIPRVSLTVTETATGETFTLDEEEAEFLQNFIGGHPFRNPGKTHAIDGEFFDVLRYGRALKARKSA